MSVALTQNIEYIHKYIHRVSARLYWLYCLMNKEEPGSWLFIPKQQNVKKIRVNLQTFAVLVTFTDTHLQLKWHSLFFLSSLFVFLWNKLWLQPRSPYQPQPFSVSSSRCSNPLFSPVRPGPTADASLLPSYHNPVGEAFDVVTLQRKDA